ncbi:MAG: acylphosphatase [Bacteroidales bacterium]|nr:acylphosphatase [Bacteroidales bacterium]
MPDVRKIHRKITVTGRVQGVGFRFSCRTMAQSLGIKGFVKNLYTGDVYIEAEGTEVQMKHFIEWCYKGPGYANVRDVIIDSGDVRGFKFFDITH